MHQYQLIRYNKCTNSRASQVALAVKKLPDSAEDKMQEFSGSIPGSGRCPGGGHGNQYSCLENPMDKGTWWATVHGVTKSQTGLGD